MLPKIRETKLKIINLEQGNVFHALKSNDNDFKRFGEAYFSSINFNDIKAWKKHKIMTLNLVVISGLIKFVFYDDRIGSSSKGSFSKFLLGPDNNYSRLTVPPEIWMGFQGCHSGKNILLNIADIVHDPNESLNVRKDYFSYKW